MHRRAFTAAMLASMALGSLLASAGCATTAPLRELRGEGLGSTWVVKIAGPQRWDSNAARAGIQKQVDDVAHAISRWEPTSQLSALNASPQDGWIEVSPLLFAALSYAFELAAQTGGAYDPTVAPLVDAWGFGTHGRRYDPPSSAEIEAARERVGYAKVILDPAAHRVRRPAGVQIDLSSMQHGFGADQVATYLRSLGVTGFLIDVGSEIRAQGHSPDGEPWHVAVERPPDEISALPPQSPSTRPTSTAQMHALNEAPLAPSHRIALRDAGIATSGNYRYFFDYNGRRYSHRIDPRTAEPITYPLASVTVIDPQCVHADALATALTVLGPDAGFEFAQRRGLAALFILRTEQGLTERMTSAFASYLAD